MKTTLLKRLLAIITFGIALLGLAPAALAAPENRLVLQVSDSSEITWNQALNVARNVQAAFGKDKVAIEIVLFGHGIGLAKFDANQANRVAELIEGGVTVSVCENTMKAQKLTRKDMNESVSYVPAGIVQIMKRQQEGWAYVRP